jgi:ABC-type dipeptide/oligopeptide/nickel transport system ATPase component
MIAAQTPIIKESSAREYVNVNELFKAAYKQSFLIALAGREQVLKGKSNKSPAIKWEKNPKGYIGLDDVKYPTGIICGYIETFKRYLVVIDLDIPKEEGHIAIDELKSVCEPIITSTYSVETPSGGIHIYILSRDKPKAKQPKINIDYQTNTGNGRGKYVVADYRWNDKGKKEVYQRLPESFEKIECVENSDLLLKDILSNLNYEGKLSTTNSEYEEDIIKLLLKYYVKGTRDEYSLALIGFLRKNGYSKDKVTKIIKKVFAEDEELDLRLKKVERTFEKPLKEIIGFKWIQEHFTPLDCNKLVELTKATNGDIKLKILQLLSNNKEPPAKLVADYVNSKLKLYKNLNTNKYYEKTEEGQFKEIDELDIVKFCNMEFAVNSISSRRCNDVLKYITNPIKKNYNLIEFNNGILDTSTRKFTETKLEYNETPKIAINLDWNDNAPSGRIGEIVEDILKNNKHPNNQERWMRAVGHAFMGQNIIGKHTIVVGVSGSGKSTLNSILMRIFNYSNLPINTINANERFTLHTLIDRDINLDDDLNNGMLKSIGTLNTITTGNGLEVEVKGENKTIQAGNEQIPRLFSSGNSLPPVIGEGYQRRLLLIHADNKVANDKKDETLQHKIIAGGYDKNGIEWVIYKAINTYWEKINSPMTTEEEEKQMNEYYEFKSYPLKKVIEAIFEVKISAYIPVNEVNSRVKAGCRYAYDTGIISKDHRKPSIKKIRSAMDYAGFDQATIREKNGTIKVYEDIAFLEDDKWQFLLNPYKEVK